MTTPGFSDHPHTPPFEYASPDAPVALDTQDHNFGVPAAAIAPHDGKPRIKGHGKWAVAVQGAGAQSIADAQPKAEPRWQPIEFVEVPAPTETDADAEEAPRPEWDLSIPSIHFDTVTLEQATANSSYPGTPLVEWVEIRDQYRDLVTAIAAKNKEAAQKGEQVREFRLWGRARDAAAGAALMHADEILSDSDILHKPDLYKDVFDVITAEVQKDIKGAEEKRWGFKGQDKPEFDVGQKLHDLLKAEEVKDPEVLKKATDTMGLLLTVGAFKFADHGNDTQLQTALGLLEAYTEA